MTVPATLPTMNAVLGREPTARAIADILARFDAECRSPSFNKGIYVYGAPGAGKSEFVSRLLAELNYDVVRYDSGDLRNKALIESLTHNNISGQNVLQMMHGADRKIAIVMDEIDGMNSGDKGGITALIKLIRQKKTKKQRAESITLVPIICIGDYCADKKIKELIKGCSAFELKAPTAPQMRALLALLAPALARESADRIDRVVAYAQSDIRRLLFAAKLHAASPELLFGEPAALETVFRASAHNEDAKDIVRHLLTAPEPVDRHNAVLTDANRTIVSLLYHENVPDAFRGMPAARTLPFYARFLDNMCFADYIDRLTFQNQIWIFNEMSSLLKVFRGNQMFHDAFPELRGAPPPAEVRFTKILTKYSTEYNNQGFVFSLCQKLDLDKKDMIAFFREVRSHAGGGAVNAEFLADCERRFGNHWVSRLDARRIYRYLDKNARREAVDEDALDVELEEEP